MADIVEELFGAIDTIVETRLQNLGFDKTITCTIESLEEQAIEGNEHKYIVTDGTTKYTVYSTSLYKVGTSVYVIIPNGDYTQKKFIVGYNVSSSDLDMSSVDTDIFVRMTNSY